MRLSVFSPTSSAQLFIDLKKIYQDYLPAEQLSTQAMQALINNKQKKLFVSLFNERHLAALQVELTGKQAQLDLLTVRDITRRRGVAKNLLSEVEKHLKSAGVIEVKMNLNKIQEAEKNGLCLFMQVCGYQLIKNEFIKAL